MPKHITFGRECQFHLFWSYTKQQFTIYSHQSATISGRTAKTLTQDLNLKIAILTYTNQSSNVVRGDGEHSCDSSSIFFTFLFKFRLRNSKTCEQPGQSD